MIPVKIQTKLPFENHSIRRVSFTISPKVHPLRTKSNLSPKPNQTKKNLLGRIGRHVTGSSPVVTNAYSLLLYCSVFFGRVLQGVDDGFWVGRKMVFSGHMTMQIDPQTPSWRPLSWRRSIGRLCSPIEQLVAFFCSKLQEALPRWSTDQQIGAQQGWSQQQLIDRVFWGRRSRWRGLWGYQRSLIVSLGWCFCDDGLFAVLITTFDPMEIETREVVHSIQATRKNPPKGWMAQKSQLAAAGRAGRFRPTYSRALLYPAWIDRASDWAGRGRWRPC